MAKNLVKFKKAIEELSLSIDLSKPLDLKKLLAKWGEIWPPLKSALECVKESKWTNAKTDKVIDEILKAGNKVSDTEALKALLQKVITILDKIRKVVKGILDLLPGLDKEGKVGKFLAVLDWIEASLKI